MDRFRSFLARASLGQGVEMTATTQLGVVMGFPHRGWCLLWLLQAGPAHPGKVETVVALVAVWACGYKSCLDSSPGGLPRQQVFVVGCLVY